MVLQGGAKVTTAEKVANQTGDVEDQIYVQETKPAKPVSVVSTDDDDDDTLSYFAKLAEED